MIIEAYFSALLGVLQLLKEQKAHHSTLKHKLISPFMPLETKKRHIRLEVSFRAIQVNL